MCASPLICMARSQYALMPGGRTDFVLSPLLLSHPQYQNAEFLQKTLEAEIGSGLQLQDFLFHILHSCYVVVMNARDEQSSFRIFSSLNGRGMDLSPVDKLKADLLEVTGCIMLVYSSCHRHVCPYPCSYRLCASGIYKVYGTPSASCAHMCSLCGIGKSMRALEPLLPHPACRDSLPHLPSTELLRFAHMPLSPRCGFKQASQTQP